MEELIEVEVEFWRKVKYFGSVMVNKNDLEQLEDIEGGDVNQYIRNSGGMFNPIYEILSEVATEENECDWEETLEDLAIAVIKQKD